MISESYRLTTVDNPFDPFVQFDDWYAFDTNMEYNSCSYVERIADQLYKETKEEDRTKLVNQAIDQIVSMNLLGIYKKVSKKIET